MLPNPGPSFESPAGLWLRNSPCVRHLSRPQLGPARWGWAAGHPATCTGDGLASELRVGAEVMTVNVCPQSLLSGKLGQLALPASLGPLCLHGVGAPSQHLSPTFG